MAKALYGYQGGPDPRTAAELATLRARVRALESENASLRAAVESPIVAEAEFGLALLERADDALV